MPAWRSSASTGRNGAARDPSPAERRREEIVEATTAVIAEEGLHRLSLARIESRLAMSRGQLTYYFPTKESILLAVFDRMLGQMIAAATETARRQAMTRAGPDFAFERARHELGGLMAHAGTPGELGGGHLHALSHTFLAQVSHRADYRAKLAAAFAGWRQSIAADLQVSAQLSEHEARGAGVGGDGDVPGAGRPTARRSRRVRPGHRARVFTGRVAPWADAGGCDWQRNPNGG